MSKMNLHEWPVVEMTDFESVIVDVTKWPDGIYTAMFNFVESFSEDGNRGFTLCTQVEGETIREIYLKITDLINIGIFNGSNVQAHGNLYDAEHTELAKICWHQFSESEWDDDGDDSQALSPIDESGSADKFIHDAPDTIQ